MANDKPLFPTPPVFSTSTCGDLVTLESERTPSLSHFFILRILTFKNTWDIIFFGLYMVQFHRDQSCGMSAASVINGNFRQKKLYLAQGYYIKALES